MKKNNKKKFIIVLILLIGIGFAYVSTNLSILGNSSFGRSTWSVYFDNVRSLYGENFLSEIPETEGTDTTSISYSANFPAPGDSYGFYVDIVNSGDIDAMVKVSSTENIDNSYAYFEISYYDGTPIGEKDILKANSRDTLFVNVGYKDVDLDTYGIEKEAINITISIEYTTANKTGKVRDINYRSLEDDSWETITSYARNGVFPYMVGDTKNIELDGYGSHVLRVSNTSSPSECNDPTFSQSACGIVFEFADNITTHVMNPAGTYDGTSYPKGWSIGGWPETDMRSFLNNDIINLLPNSLKESIINTHLVSGGYDDNPRTFDSIDKMYLLDVTEVVGPTFKWATHFAKGYERQLDYYYENGVAMDTNFEVTVKSHPNVPTAWQQHWWLRSGIKDYNYSFYYMDETFPFWGDAFTLFAVSPAFRIGPKTMEEMSWDEITTCLRNGSSCGLKVGDTKCVHIDGYSTTNDNGCNGDFKVRLANRNRPNECSSVEFSQSACGYVFEFEDIIATHNMNPAGSYKGNTYDYGYNVDGWPASSMRTFINNDIYNSLPVDLRVNIANTGTISGYGGGDQNGSGPNGNWYTLDKLYLLSTAEVWVQGTSNQVTYDEGRDFTRQLDYYRKLGVSTNNYGPVKKQFNGTYIDWWNRSARSLYPNAFIAANGTGNWGFVNAKEVFGVSPAFKVSN